MCRKDGNGGDDALHGCSRVRQTLALLVSRWERKTPVRDWTLWLWLCFRREPGQGTAAAVSLVFAPVTPALVQFVPELASTDVQARDGCCCFYFRGGRSRFYSRGQSSLARPQGQDTGWGCSAALTSPFQLCPVPELCCGAAAVRTPSLPAPRGAARLGKGSECAGHWGLTRATSPSLVFLAA